MSIQKTAFNLCKKVQKSPNRDLIKNFIGAIHFNNENAIFRQVANDVSKYPKVQFLSYLMIAQEREAIEQQIKLPLTVLEEDEIYLLANCHEQMLKLNDKCISVIVESIPQVRLALSPYNVPLYKKQNFDGNFELFDDEATHTLVTAFHNHPAVRVALKTLEKLSNQFSEQDYFSNIARMSDELIESTPFKSPDWLKNLSRNNENAPLHHMLALMSIRDSLTNLNQLIFQAIVEIDDKLMILDEEKIIDLSPTYYCDSGAAVSILAQGSGDIRFLLAVEPVDFNSGYIVLLKEIYGYKGIQLGRVEASRSTLFNDYNVAKFNIRIIDEHLNSFPFVLRSRRN